MLKKDQNNTDLPISALHNRLFFRLFQTSNTLDRQSLKILNISPIHWSVLGALSRPSAKSGMSFSDLTHYLGVSRQSLDGVLKRLEKEGELQRVADLQDRRVKNVALTPQGEAVWAELQIKVAKFYEQSFKDFRFDDLITMVHLLNKLNDGMEHVDSPN